LLLSSLVVTTAVFFAFQLSRYQDEKSATGRFISSILKGNNRNSGTSRRSTVGGSANGKGAAQGINFNDRISAFAKQFQKELGTIIQDKEDADTVTKPQEQAGIDHPIPSLISTEHIPEKSPQEAAEDQQIGLQDLDQETLRAMFDALYARD